MKEGDDMEMKLYDRIHWVNEAIDALGIVYNNVKVNEIIAKVNRKKQSQEVEKTKELYLFLKQDIQVKEHLKKYFIYLSQGEFCSIAHLLVHTFVSDDELMQEDYKTLIQQRFHEFSLEKFPKVVETVMGFDLMNDKQSLIDSLIQLHVTDQEKLHLISAFYHFERTLDEICAEIDLVIKINK